MLVLLVLVMAGGRALFSRGWDEGRLGEEATLKPQVLTLAELEAFGTQGNAHVRVAEVAYGLDCVWTLCATPRGATAGGR